MIMMKKIIEMNEQLEIEIRQASDIPGIDCLDPRVKKELIQMSKAEQKDSGEVKTLEDIRKDMGGFNYNLNSVEIYTKYIEIETPYKPVPVWMYYPRKLQENGPALIYVHGGGFLGGSPFAVENQCRLIAERANCVVWNVDYALAPEYAYPAAVEQIYKALSQLWNEAEDYMTDRSRIYIAGDSAGGSHAAVVAMMDRDQSTHYLAGEIFLYGKFTFVNEGLTGYARDLGAFHLNKEEKEYLPILTAIGSDEANEGDAAVYIQGRCGLTEPYASPAFGNKTGLPRTLLIQAEYDGLRLEGEFYGKQLLKARVPVKMIQYRGVNHAFFDKLGILPQAEDAVDAIAAFIIEK